MVRSKPAANAIELDDVARRLLRELERDARASFAELGRRVGLSPPAVAERMRRLEDLGVITGYRAMLNPARLGRPITAIVRMRVTPEHYPWAKRQIDASPEILECHHVTGEDAFVLKLVVATVEDIDRVIGRFAPHAATSTSIVLSTLVADRPITDL